MEKATVYYTNFRTKLEEGLPAKLKRLLYTAGIGMMSPSCRISACLPRLIRWRSTRRVWMRV